MEEEIYDEAEVGTIKSTDTANLSVKERLALLQSKNNEAGGNKPSPPRKPGQVGSNNNTVSNFPLNRPPIAGKPTGIGKQPTAAAMISAAIANRSPTLNLNDLKTRKQSLKFIHKRDSQASTTSEETIGEEQEEEIVVTKDKRKFKKLPFVKHARKPAKPASLNSVVLPVVSYIDAETGVEKRIGAGRVNTNDSFIKSLSEDEELREELKSMGPALPSTPHPPHVPSVGHRTLPSRPDESFPPPPPAILEPAADELYGDAEVDRSFDQEGQELYEEFDEIQPPPPPMPSRNHPEAPQPIPSPDLGRKLSKADKEKEKKEKLKQEKLAKEREKQRQKEAKDREVFMKKFKVTDDELISSHYVEAKNASSGGKMMLAVKAKEKLQLIRKTGCPDGKWIVRNPNADLVGLVDANNMIDLDELVANGVSVGGPIDVIDEEIYEELT